MGSLEDNNGHLDLLKVEENIPMGNLVILIILLKIDSLENLPENYRMHEVVGTIKMQ